MIAHKWPTITEMRPATLEKWPHSFGEVAGGFSKVINDLSEEFNDPERRGSRRDFGRLARGREEAFCSSDC
jgi:hypothetical protein